MSKGDSYDSLYVLIGARISQVRMHAGLSQEKLAGQVRVSRTSIVNIEQGRQRLPIHLLWSIATALEVEPTELLPSAHELSRHGATELDPAIKAIIEQAAQRDPEALQLLSAFVGQFMSKKDITDESASD